MLDESITLCDTLNWRVMHSQTLGVESYRKRSFFGRGQISSVAETIRNHPDVLSLFLRTYKLKEHQRIELEHEWQVLVLDRYNLVLQIFQHHARTRYAKLQESLAELPYLRQRLAGAYQMEGFMKHDPARKGEKYFEMMLKNRRIER